MKYTPCLKVILKELNLSIPYFIMIYCLTNNIFISYTIHILAYYLQGLIKIEAILTILIGIVFNLIQKSTWTLCEYVGLTKQILLDTEDHMHKILPIFKYARQKN